MLGAIFSAIVLWRVLKIEKMLKKLAVPSDCSRKTQRRDKITSPQA